MNTKQLFETWPGLEPEDREALLSIISTRGKWKGYVLANAPSERQHPKRYYVWQAVVSYLAPVRVSISGLMFASDEHRKFHDDLDRVLRESKLYIALNPVEPPFRWNLYAHQRDIDAERRGVAKYIEQRAA